MGFLLMLLLIHLIVCTVVLLLGIALGYLLRWFWPGMEMGLAILVGVVVNAVSILIIWSTVSALPEPAPAEVAADDDEPPVLYAVPPFPVQRRPQRRRRQ